MENFDYVKFNADNILKDIRSSGNDVILLAVSKTFPVQAIIAAAQIGIRLFGESKVQEAQEKIAQIGRADLSWHLIGHLQSNKANKAA
ncbi:MAG: YggS family pyridoxal phosphate enzyme, partial [Spirochaetia bacterium]|nr:YggS family pyridoxal phosphate enzyme [Spirochaetia bacterium]